MVSGELVKILTDGKKAKEFDVEKIQLSAKMITTYTTGVRMTMPNEKSLFSDEELIQSFENHCLKIVGVRTTH